MSGNRCSAGPDTRRSTPWTGASTGAPGRGRRRSRSPYRARRRAGPPEPDARRGSRRVLVEKVQVHVLERAPPHLELLELAPLRDRQRRELVQRARRLIRLDDLRVAVLAVTDLRAGRRDELRRRSLGDDHAVA